MLYDLAVMSAKIAGIVVALLLARAVQLHLRFKASMRRLQKQGVEIYPGSDTFLIGAVAAIDQERERRS